MRYKFPLYLSMIIAIYGAAAEGAIKFDVYNIPFNILYEQYFLVIEIYISPRLGSSQLPLHLVLDQK